MCVCVGVGVCMCLSLRMIIEEYPKIQNGDWDTNTQCVNCGNQGPCWDAADTLGLDQAQERAETLAPWTPSQWKASPRHDTLKEQVGLCQPIGLSGLHSAGPPDHCLQTCLATDLPGPWPMGLLCCCPLACWATTHYTPDGPQAHWPPPDGAPAPPDASSIPV
jgi:hypothetical protein